MQLRSFRLQFVLSGSRICPRQLCLTPAGWASVIRTSPGRQSISKKRKTNPWSAFQAGSDHGDEENACPKRFGQQALRKVVHGGWRSIIPDPSNMECGLETAFCCSCLQRGAGEALLPKRCRDRFRFWRLLEGTNRRETRFFCAHSGKLLKLDASSGRLSRTGEPGKS